MKTLGQAIDEAVTRAAAVYPGANVYGARAVESSTNPDQYRVELDAAHFSRPLVYYVDR